MAEIIDSGERREFTTGAVRDMAEGKGRCDLMPIGELAAVFKDSFLLNLSMFLDELDIGILNHIIESMAVELFGDSKTAMLELAKHYEDGCRKYGERNWEKGIPCHCYVDSAIRHYLKYQRGDQDERHDRACLWNLCGLLWTLIHKPEMNDLEGANA